MAEEKKKKKNGRPRVEFDLEVVRRLAAMHCTYAEIGAFFGCSHDTVQRRMGSDPDFRAAMEAGKGEGMISLRRLQWRSAKAGSVKMQVWLGKQLLGQRDKQDLTSGGERMGPVAVVNVPSNGREAKE